MRYYAKFNNGSQTKNKAQEAAYNFGKPAGGTLIGSDAALEKFIDKIIEGVNRINGQFHRCSNIDARKHLYAHSNDYSISVGDIFSISFFPVKQDYSISEPVIPDELPETVFKF